MNVCAVLLLIFVCGLGDLAATTSTTAPDPSFTYDCFPDGSSYNISITHTGQFQVKESSGKCTGTSTTTGTKTLLVDCEADIIVVLDHESNNSRIIGGHGTVERTIHCHEHVTQPVYTVEAKVEGVTVVDEASPATVNMVTYTTQATISALTMTISQGNSTATNPVPVGTQLELMIQSSNPFSGMLSPISCTAASGNETYQFWNDTCTYDGNLVEPVWKRPNQASSDVSINIYAFRFVGGSQLVTVTCNVLVCPSNQQACDLNKCPSSGRRRRSSNHMVNNHPIKSHLDHKVQKRSEDTHTAVVKSSFLVELETSGISPVTSSVIAMTLCLILPLLKVLS